MIETKVVAKIKTLILGSIFFKLVPFMRLYREIWYSQTCKDNNLIRRMRLAFFITTATDTHSELVILVTFTRQSWLQENASMEH